MATGFRVFLRRELPAADLVAAFKDRYRVTCCVTLTRSYKWKSREHLANCRKITEDTAEIVEQLLK